MRLLCVSMNAIKYHEWHFFLRNKNWGQKAIRGQINEKKVMNEAVLAYINDQIRIECKHWIT